MQLETASAAAIVSAVLLLLETRLTILYTIKSGLS